MELWVSLWDLMAFRGPFQLKPFYDSMICCATGTCLTHQKKKSFTVLTKQTWFLLLLEPTVVYTRHADTRALLHTEARSNKLHAKTHGEITVRT